MVAPELEKEGVADVAMALLFLSYGRAPFAITKLEYTSNESPKKETQLRWHQRPRDITNFTRWMSSDVERHLNWQILSLQASLDDLLDSPIL